MSFEKPINARNYTYEEWIRFVFDHPPPADQSENEWYFQDEYEFVSDESRVID